MPSAVELRQVSFSFGPNRVLANIDLVVRGGERLVIIGPSGSGKTTLLRCINGLERVDSGEIRIFGEPLGHSRKQLKAARRRMGIIFQEYNLYSMRTVLENIMLAPMHVLRVSKQEAEARAHTSLFRVGIADLAPKYPFQISGGQQQRVAIARALAMRPDILLLDEPTSALDPELVESMRSLIESLADEGLTILCVTHALGFARRLADQIAFMADGAILEQGSPEKILYKPRTNRLRSFLATLSVDFTGCRAPSVAPPKR
jgi:ABC-type polar amino acid transport system ATPase subunit